MRENYVPVDRHSANELSKNIIDSNYFVQLEKIGRTKKMKTLSCREMAMVDCDFVAKGQTDEEIVQKMTEHAKMAHKETMGDMMKKMTVDEMREAMTKKIKDDEI